MRAESHQGAAGSARPRLKRRLALAAAVAAGGGVAAALTASGPGAAAPVGPNVLLVITDDQRDGTMRVMDKTRRIFQAGGTSFRRAFVTTPQCCPSRASIYSGRYVHNHRVSSNQQADGFNTNRFLFRHLDQAGYRTAIFGKFLNGWGRSDVPHVDETLRGAPGIPAENDAELGRRAEDLIRDADDAGESWAIALALKTPHTPLKPAPRYEHAAVPQCRRYSNPGIRERDFSDKLPALRNAQDADPRPAKTCRAQLRMLMSADDVIGDVWDAVEDVGAAGPETIAVFLSDNGYYWGEHSLSGKYLPYRESLAVPMYARWPGQLDAGRVDRRFALNIDVTPTIYDAVGIDPSYEPDGRSLLEDGWKRRWLLFEGATESNHDGWPSWRVAFYDGRRHLIRWRGGFREYYNLRQDPYETENLLRSEDAARRRRAKRRARTLGAKLDRVGDCRGAGPCP